MSEADERLPVGPRGAKGERGERGLSKLQGRAIVVLFAIAAGCGAGNLFWTAHEVHSATSAQQAEQSAQQRQAAQQQAAQRAQSEAFERRLCTTLGRLAALAPPPGSPLGNPSRAYLQQQHSVLAELGPDVGC